MINEIIENTNTNLAYTNIGLAKETREKIISILNRLLADEQVLYAKTRNYHWNITGPEFITLHTLFETHYQQLQKMADDIAEHTRMLGGNAIGTLKEFLDHTRLLELPGEYHSARMMVGELLDDHGTIIHALRQDIDVCANEFNDESTADLLVQTLRAHEKMAWMLRATLDGNSVTQ